MDIKDMRYFLAIAEQGSFSAAAERLNVAQPALSIRIRKLEDRLQTELLRRGPRGVEVTEAGELLMRRARGLLLDIDRTAAEVTTLGRDPAGTVRIGLPGTISNILSVPMIAATRGLYPDIKIIVAEAMSGFVQDWLLDGSVDMAVLYRDMRDGAVRSELLLHEDLVLLMPPGRAPGDIGFDDLAALPLILPSGSHGLRGMIDAAARDRHLALDPVIEVDSYVNIKKLVAAGYGHSVLPLHAVAGEVASGDLSVRRFSGDGLRRSVYLVHGTARPLSRAAEAVQDLLKQTVDHLISDGTWAGAVRG